jgi:hypothetical protein
VGEGVVGGAGVEIVGVTMLGLGCSRVRKELVDGERFTVRWTVVEGVEIDIWRGR